MYMGFLHTLLLNADDVRNSAYPPLRSRPSLSWQASFGPSCNWWLCETREGVLDKECHGPTAGWGECSINLWFFLVFPLPAAPGPGRAGQSEIWTLYLLLGGILCLERKEFMISYSIGLMLASHNLNLRALLVCASCYHKMVSWAIVSPHLLCKVQFNILTAEFLYLQSLHFYHK